MAGTKKSADPRQKWRRAHWEWVCRKQEARQLARMSRFSAEGKAWGREYDRLHPAPRLEDMR